MTELLLLAKLLHPQKMKCSKTRKGSSPFPFEILKHLFTVRSHFYVTFAIQRCKDVKVQSCDELPPDYAPVLAKYEAIRIDELEDESSPSLVPLIRVTSPLCCLTVSLQMFLADSSSPLRYFELPFYERETFLSPDEIEKLGLEKWRIQRGPKVK